MDRQVKKDDGASIIPENLDRLIKYLPLITISHLVIGLPALIGSLALAYFAFVQADATQKMQTGGAMPFVTIGTSNVSALGEPHISLNISNNGVGPAIMGPIEIRYAGRTVATPVDLLQLCCGLPRAGNISFATAPASNVAVRPGDKVEFLRIERNGQTEKIWQRLNDERWKFKIRSCYCSIFNDCWISEGMQGLPRPVKQCPSNWALYREDADKALRRSRKADPPDA